MIDRLPFPQINANNTEDKIKQLVDYLIQFKEELEFILIDIGVDNLSADLQKKIANIGSVTENVSATNTESVSVYEILSSPAFKASVPTEYLKSAYQKVASNEPDGINLYAITDSSDKETIFQVKNGSTPKLSVNYETGELEYE